MHLHSIAHCNLQLFLYYARERPIIPELFSTYCSQIMPAYYRGQDEIFICQSLRPAGAGLRVYMSISGKSQVITIIYHYGIGVGLSLIHVITITYIKASSCTLFLIMQ